MTFKEKKLYHQIHPVKLFVDIATGILTTFLLWQHNITWFCILAFLPSVLISLALIKFVDLIPQKNSGFGKYIEKYMTAFIEAIRITGQIIMWVAAWYHSIVLVLVGFLIIIGGWLNGIILKR